MKPIKFKESNINFVADGCGDLPAYKGCDQIISCWHLTPLERLRVLCTGRIFLSIFGNAQPPVNVMAETPFVKRIVYHCPTCNKSAVYNRNSLIIHCKYCGAILKGEK